MPAPGKYLENLTVGAILWLGPVPISRGTGAPTAANAYGSADAIYVRTGTGSAATMIYVSADTGVTWRVVSVS